MNNKITHFAEVALSNQTPQHVRTVVAIGRPMKRLLAEEVSVTTLAVDGVAASTVHPVRATVGGGHFELNEMHARAPAAIRVR
jgi:hypothetical protein